MLNTDVTNAIEQGLFHLYAVEHINEGIEILTGYPMGQLNKKLKYPKKTINRCVHNRLKLFKKILKKA
jgi:predicted ATP-dependent protease